MVVKEEKLMALVAKFIAEHATKEVSGAAQQSVLVAPPHRAHRRVTHTFHKIYGNSQDSKSRLNVKELRPRGS